MTKLIFSPIFEGEDIVWTVGLANGQDKAQAFIHSLTPKDQAKFRKYFEYLRQGFQIKNPENMRHISGARDPTGGEAEVHELKVHRGGGLRLYVVRYQGRWYATHGRKKPQDRQAPKEARKAFDIFYADQHERK